MWNTTAVTSANTVTSASSAPTRPTANGRATARGAAAARAFARVALPRAGLRAVVRGAGRARREGAAIVVTSRGVPPHAGGRSWRAGSPRPRHRWDAVVDA